jgi:hypothetical protein
LYIGAIGAATNIDQLLKNEIRLVVNCTPFVYTKSNHIEYVDAGFHDNTDCGDAFLTKFQTIKEPVLHALSANQRVLIHCRSGQNR